MKVAIKLALPIAAICLVGITLIMMFLATRRTSNDSEFAPGSFSAILGPNQPNGSENFANAAFRFLYVIGFGIDGYVVNPKGDLVNVRIANSGDIGCRTDAIAVNRTGDWLYLGCTRVWMGRESEPSVLPCRILGNGWIKPALDLRVSTGTRPLTMTVDSSGKHLYVATRQGIYQYNLGTDGKARPMTPEQPPGSFVAAGVVISPNSRYAYATNFTQHRIYQFQIDGEGSLRPLDPAFIETGPGPMEARCDPHGRYVWCLDSLGDSIDRFEVEADGRLRRLSAAADQLGRQASSLAITPDGDYAYVARYRYNSVLQYCIQSDGTFTKNDPMSAPGSGSPSVIRVAPDGRYAMALNFQHGMVSLYTVNSKGTLDPADPSVELCSGNAHDVVFVPRKPTRR